MRSSVPTIAVAIALSFCALCLCAPASVDARPAMHIMRGFAPLDETPLPFDRTKVTALPASYDFRTAEPHCASPILDQGNCNSCWAFAASGSLGDRFCKAMNLSSPLVLSPQDLLDCEMDHIRCEMGSLPGDVWDHMIKFGVATMDCVYYDSGEPEQAMCPWKTCQDSEDPIKRYHAADKTHHKTVEDMMTALVTGGPLDVTFNVYGDFDGYTGGVYVKSKGANWEGLHSVKIVGYGTDTASGKDYWLIANSWGNSWGPYEGYFMIERGTNMCGVESLAYSGHPNVEAFLDL